MTDYVSPALERPLRTEAQVRAAKRAKTLCAMSAEVLWYWPGFDSFLRIEVHHDRFGSRYVNDVLDAEGNQFPYDQVCYEGRSLVEILEAHIRDQPELMEGE